MENLTFLNGDQTWDYFLNSSTDKNKEEHVSACLSNFIKQSLSLWYNTRKLKVVN